ncbi:ATP-dependent DNA helicase RecQ [Bacteroidota bacterium]
MVFNTPEETLKNIWGYPDFRPGQLEIIQSVLGGQDTLAVLPTGGGKSLCFQIPGLCMEGLCLVISPLIALMKDQVEQLRQQKVIAYAIYSGMTRKEIEVVLDNCQLGKVKFLYISPERLKSDHFVERAKHIDISLLAIDEAHCISQWGYDFRPSYLDIADFRNVKPDATVIALTATATPEVRNDIIEKLRFNKEQIFIQSFARTNLSFLVREVEDKYNKLVEILNKTQGSSIVYVRTRKKTKEITEYLLRQNISAGYYHAGLTNDLRSRRQYDWVNNKFRVMVSTNAFGMGINKPDVRNVFHLNIPDNIEHYYQEGGRAGRDGKHAYAVLLWQKIDVEELNKRAELSYPSSEIMRKVYQALANYYKIAVGSSMLTSHDFDISEFVNNYNLDHMQTFHALKRLEDQGFIQMNDSFYHPSKLFIRIDHMELYKFQVANRKYDDLIKGILRIYGGELYTNFKTINETRIARHIKSNPASVERFLSDLDKQEIVVYDKQKDKPQVIFLTPRYDANKLPINEEWVRMRKESEKKRNKSMIHYTNQEVKCRMQVLQEYFGENVTNTCGKCDICLEKNKPYSSENYSRLHVRILKELSKSSFKPDEISMRFKDVDIKEIKETIKLMMDSGELHFDVSGLIEVSDINKI